MDYRKIGEHIRRFRKYRGLTQETLAEAADLSVSYLSHVERGTKKVSLEVLVQIARALNVGVDEFLFERKETERSEKEAEIQNLLADCSPEEQCVIWDAAKAVKDSLRRNFNVA